MSITLKVGVGDTVPNRFAVGAICQAIFFGIARASETILGIQDVWVKDSKLR